MKWINHLFAAYSITLELCAMAMDISFFDLFLKELVQNRFRRDQFLITIQLKQEYSYHLKPIFIGHSVHHEAIPKSIVFSLLQETSLFHDSQLLISKPRAT